MLAKGSPIHVGQLLSNKMPRSLRLFYLHGFKDIPGESEHFFSIVRYCYRSFKQL